MKVFYYTATGNSLEVAKAFGGECISIPAVMKSDVTTFDDDVIGLVVPNHHGTPPLLVLQFLQRVSLKAAYVFAIVTYGEFNGATTHKLVAHMRAQGITVSYANSIKMVDSSFVYWDIEKQIENLPKKRVPEHIGRLVSDVAQRRHAIADGGILGRVGGFLVSQVPHEHNHHERFYVETGKCIGCGMCVKVCPIDNVELAGKHPVIGSKCVRCGACTHNCPKNAIRYRGEKSAARYRNANIKVTEIVRANNTRFGE